MVISFSDLSDKEVINLCDGKRLGYVCDIERIGEDIILVKYTEVQTARH